MFKKLALITILLISSTSSVYAIFGNNPNYSKNTKAPNCPNTCFIENISGLLDNPEISAEKSKDKGLSIQYVAHEKKLIDSYGINEERLAAFINAFASDSAEYFKNNPKYKGIFTASFIYYPGYKTPYQYDFSDIKDPVQKQSITNLNANIKQIATCNKEGFCSALIPMSLAYLDRTPAKLKLNGQEYGEFMNKKAFNKLNAYPSKKSNYKYRPIKINVMMGTNGFHASIKDFNEYLQSQ